MTSSMIVKQSVSLDDEPFLYQLYRETRVEEILAFGWGEEECETFLRMQFEMQKRSYAMQFLVTNHEVIWQDNVRIGRMLTEITDQSIRIIDVTLLAAYRNKGIGTGLIREIQARAEKIQKSVQLHVMDNNPAQQLYLRLGFKVTEEKIPYYAMEWRAGE